MGMVGAAGRGAVTAIDIQLSATALKVAVTLAPPLKVAPPTSVITVPAANVLHLKINFLLIQLRRMAVVRLNEVPPSIMVTSGNRIECCNGSAKGLRGKRKLSFNRSTGISINLCRIDFSVKNLLNDLRIVCVSRSHNRTALWNLSQR